MMKALNVILALLMAFAAFSGSRAMASQDVLSLVAISDVPSNINPVFECGEFALVGKNQIAGIDIPSRELFPDQPGDYYVMRILDPQKLARIENRIPFMLIGEHAVFRTDPAGAEMLPTYGWGLTRISTEAIVERGKPEVPPAIDVVYDPDIAAMISGITPASCESTLSLLTSFATRYSYTTGCRNAEDSVYGRMNAMSLATSFFNFTWNSTNMRNVIGQLTGTVSPESVVIVCGHLDCTSETPNILAPGAEDNGSGSAAVLEAARVLSQHQTELTVRFITFSGEEQGLIGSDEYADSMQNAGEIIAGVINLDMVGYRGPYANDMHIFSDPQSHWLGSLAAEVMDLYTDIDTITAYEGSPRYGSDHYPFATRGYPAIFFIDAWSGPDWYPYYHTTADTLGNLDMNLLASVTRSGTALAAELARVDFANPDPIPTLSEWGMLILALLLLLAGTLSVVRRKKLERAESVD